MKKFAVRIVVCLQILILIQIIITRLSNQNLREIAFCSVGIIVFFCYKLFRLKIINCNTKTSNKYNLLFILTMTLFVTALQVKPSADQWLLVQTAHEIKNYNYSAFAEGGYLFRYPFQAGLVLFYFVMSFFIGESNYIVLQLLNILAVIYMLYCLVNYITVINGNKSRISDEIKIAFLLCYPVYVYIVYIYGTLIGFSLGIGSLYHLLIYKNAKRNKDAVISIILLTLSIVVKPNGKIILVAAVLYILYWMIQKELKFKEAIILVMGYIIMGNISNQIIALSILKITGISLSKGMPMLGWIAMGLSEGGEAPGAYSGFVVNTFIKNGYDYKLTSQYAMQEIMSRLHYFGTNIKDATRFFSEKVIYQWGDATFNADKILNYGNTSHESALIYKVVSSSAITLYARIYQIGVFFGSGVFFWLKRKTIQIEDMMLSVVFIGGFIFHLFWESSPTYTVTYFLLLIPYAVLGFEELALLVHNRFFEKLKGIEYIKHRTLRGIKFLLLVLLASAIVFGSKTDNDKQLTSIKNGYYTIECSNYNSKKISLQNNEITVKLQGDENLTIALNKETNLYQIRFYPSGKLLAVNKDKMLIGYIDSIVNMEYQELPEVQYEWSIISNENGGYYIVIDQLALTYTKEEGQLKLIEFENAKNKTWLLNQKK